MFQTIIDAFKIKEVRRKIILTLVLLLVYRVGCWIPVPGLDLSAFQISGDGFLGILNGVTGNALSNGAILALGVVPYINASIIMQLLTIAIPKLERLARQGGEEGKKKITFYSRILALVLALAQSIGLVVGMFGGYLDPNGSIGSTFVAGMIVVLVLTAGAMFTVWIGEKITELGVGNGQSMLVFVGILATAGRAIVTEINSVAGNIDLIWTFFVFLAAVVIIFGFITFIDMAERKVPVQYAKQIKGRKMYGGQSTFIPIKINSNGVMPIIFAMALLTFPQLIFSMVGSGGIYPSFLQMGGWLYTVLVAVLIFFFSYFYAQATFNPADVSRQIQQNGGFIPGIRAGQPTAEYLTKISRRITFFGALFLAVVALVPTLIFGFVASGSSLVNAFSATGLIIVVSVALEFNKQLEAQLLMRNYKGFLK